VVERGAHNLLVAGSIPAEPIFAAISSYSLLPDQRTIDVYPFERYCSKVKKESIVLIGMPGSGKSIVGKALGKKLGYAFTDLDIYLYEKGYLSIQNIIDTQGESALLQIEKSQMYQIDLYRRVVSPGGSIIYHPDLMLYLKEKALLVYLDEDFYTIEKRIRNLATRGIIGLKTRSLKEIYEERSPLYQKYADVIIKPAGKSLDGLLEEITILIKHL
jgi:shikimate kinase